MDKENVNETKQQTARTEEQDPALRDKVNDALLDFIDRSPTAFHAVANAAGLLEQAGYVKLTACREDDVKPGGRYYLTRNDSSLIAFRLPKGGIRGLRISASHSDSPSFKVKESPEIDVEGHYVKLNTEGYGGMIMSTWMDRPLSIAGRAVVKEGNGFATRLVNFDQDMCIIPNVAIHFNREINKGYAYNPQVDLQPLFAEKLPEGSSLLKSMCAGQLGVETEDIFGSDLFLYNRDKGRKMGAEGEFIGSPRLDDLQCAFGTLTGFLEADRAGEDTEYGAVYALFDNEEIGSGTKQGADSTFLTDTIDCICDALGWTGRQKREVLEESFLLSADNAHGVHPNHPEKSDPTNRPYLNGGIVLKFQGSQKYTTDAWSAALVRSLCRGAQIPCQDFANRADIAGGSTLGNISSAHLSIPAADIGLAQLAMHSAFETAGARDTEYLVRLCRAFFEGK